jgi:hypothetical protein
MIRDGSYGVFDPHTSQVKPFGEGKTRDSISQLQYSHRRGLPEFAQANILAHARRQVSISVRHFLL